MKAHEYDDKAKKLWIDNNKGHNICNIEFVPCYRREAITLLAAGRPRDAVQVLAYCEKSYIVHFTYANGNLTASHFLSALTAALKVLADALEQTAPAHNRSRWFTFFRAPPSQDLIRAGRIRTDVEETEAIVAAYREGVLDETRRELRDQQQAVATAAAASGAPGSAAKKS